MPTGRKGHIELGSSTTMKTSGPIIDVVSKFLSFPSPSLSIIFFSFVYFFQFFQPISPLSHFAGHTGTHVAADGTDGP